jgi:acetolactate synthase-1/2/3 large subunit
VDLHVLRQAIELLQNAKKPLIMAGHGVIKAEASAELLRFAEKTGIPVTTTFLGVGSFPEDHPLSLGMPGMHGWVHVNRAIQECDLLLNIGGRFEDRVTGKVSTFAPHAQVIHVDIDPSEINKNVKATLALIGDAKQILQALVAEMPSRDTKDWLKHIREMQTKYQPQQQYTRNQYQKRHAESDLMPHDVFAALTKIINERGNYRVVTDVGQNQMWAVQLIDWYRPKTHISSGGLGTMGFALPAALGVAVACPNDTVWVIAGDGGFQMTNQEMITIMQEGIKNIKVVLINNGYLGMVRQWQELFENKRYSGTPLTGPNFVKLAEAYGVRGITVNKLEEVEAAILEAYAHDGPILLEFQVEREVNVFPMVPQGNSIGEMITKDPQPESEVVPEPVLAAV